MDAPRSHRGAVLAFSFQGLLLASVLYSLPLRLDHSRRPSRAWTGAWSRRRGASACPDCAPSFASSVRSWRLEFSRGWSSALHTLGEFGVVLMVGGNIPGVTRTISISIYDEVQAVNYSKAAMTSLVLLASSFLALSVTHLVNRKTL